MFVQVSSLQQVRSVEGVGGGSPGGYLILSLVGATVPCGIWREQPGRKAMCVMSSPRKAEVFLRWGAVSVSLTISSSASRDIGRLCGCILLEPGVC